MIVVDTSVWVDHLRAGNPRLSSLLQAGLVLSHPFVAGELACGNLRNRTEVLTLLGDLPQAPLARDKEVLDFIEHYRLMGRGIGYIDAHLLTAAALAGDARLWTLDQRLAALARRLTLDYDG